MSEVVPFHVASAMREPAAHAIAEEALRKVLLSAHGAEFAFGPLDGFAEFLAQTRRQALPGAVRAASPALPPAR